MKLFINILVLIAALFASCKGGPRKPTQGRYKNKVAVELSALVASKTDADEYAMIFVAKQDSNLQLPIVIGATEAQALAIAIEQIPHDNPLPLDLFETLINQSGFTLNHVVIDSLIDSVYTAKIIYTAADNKKKKIKSRCCDAVTLAVKFDCPIFMTKELLKNY